MGAFSKTHLNCNIKSGMAHIGSFRPNGSSDTTADSDHIHGNWISTAAHTATGKYTVTMKSDYRKQNGPIIAMAQLRMGAALSWARAGEVSMTNGTIVVYTYTEASDTTAAADIADGANNWIDLFVVTQTSNVIDGNDVDT